MSGDWAEVRGGLQKLRPFTAFLERLHLSSWTPKSGSLSPYSSIGDSMRERGWDHDGECRTVGARKSSVTYPYKHTDRREMWWAPRILIPIWMKLSPIVVQYPNLWPTLPSLAFSGEPWDSLSSCDCFKVSLPNLTLSNPSFLDGAKWVTGLSITNKLYVFVHTECLKSTRNQCICSTIKAEIDQDQNDIFCRKRHELGNFLKT